MLIREKKMTIVALSIALPFMTRSIILPELRATIRHYRLVKPIPFPLKPLTRQEAVPREIRS